ncbi:MAG: hypothetical protein ABIL58_02630 [Pseudomonadota bacterium]
MTEANNHSASTDSPCAREGEFIIVELTGREALLRQLRLLFSGGVGIEVVAGCTVREMLCGQLGIAPDYVEGRLQTVFLNGKPVDDIDAARAGAGDMLALSAAMPGLVGATMRRGGRYAVFRQGITYTGEADCPLDPEPICLTLKLFNLIAAELAPVLLKRGVWIDGDRLADHMALMGSAVWDAMAGARIDGTPAGQQTLALALRARRVHLRVESS